MIVNDCIKKFNKILPHCFRSGEFFFKSTNQSSNKTCFVTFSLAQCLGYTEILVSYPDDKREKSLNFGRKVRPFRLLNYVPGYSLLSLK